MINYNAKSSNGQPKELVSYVILSVVFFQDFSATIKAFVNFLDNVIIHHATTDDPSSDITQVGAA